MKIIAHRGAWIGDDELGILACEKNSVEAFVRATEHGFGIETDFRDICGKVVISHNPPCEDALSARDFFKLTKPGQIIAVNVKADGIAEELKLIWQEVAPEACPYAFDMSVPDTLGYLKADFPFLERQSEYEKGLVWSASSGIWLDGFHSLWFTPDDIDSLLKSGKSICIVSPELHGRPYLSFWETLKGNLLKWPERTDDIWLCTDEPFMADRFFRRIHD